MAAHAHLKNEFTEDEKYHNLMTWLIYLSGFEQDTDHKNVPATSSRYWGSIWRKVSSRYTTIPYPMGVVVTNSWCIMLTQRQFLLVKCLHTYIDILSWALLTEAVCVLLCKACYYISYSDAHYELNTVERAWKLQCIYCMPYAAINCVGWEKWRLSHIMRKPVFAICEQQRCRSACTWFFASFILQ